jgi:hypothetical protein
MRGVILARPRALLAEVARLKAALGPPTLSTRSCRHADDLLPGDRVLVGGPTRMMADAPA